MELIIKSKTYGDKAVLIDEEDYPFLARYKWGVSRVKDKLYVKANDQTKQHRNISMHRLLMCRPGEPVVIDHKDRNTLNNQKSNLRRCTFHQNNTNKKPHTNSTSKYLGVCKKINKRSIKWRANIRINGKQTSLGFFDTEQQAAIAYDNAAKIHFGEFAYLNFRA
jgi:hypothetical protein